MQDFNIMEDSLLTMEQICEKLSISRSTLDRWRGIGNIGLIKKQPTINDFLGNYMDSETTIPIPFPKPILNIGRSPRWSANEINRWIQRLQRRTK